MSADPGAANPDNAASGALSNADSAAESDSAPAAGASVKPYGSEDGDGSSGASSDGADALALTDNESDGVAPYAMAYYAVLYDSDGDGTGEKLVFQNSSLGLSKFGTKVNSWSFSEDASYSYSSKAPWYAAYSSIKSIQFNCPLSPVSLRYWFYGLSKLESIDFANLDTSAVTDMKYMFYDCSSIKELDLSSFDTSKVTGMTAMFTGCSRLVGGSGTAYGSTSSSVTSRSLARIDAPGAPGYFTDKNAMGAAVLYSDGALVFQADASPMQGHGDVVSSYAFNLSGVGNGTTPWAGASSQATSAFFAFPLAPQSMRYWFSGFSKLESIDFANLDTSAVTDMGCMFYDCSSLKALDLSSFDTSAVTGMKYMFYDCSSIKELDLSSFDTSKVKDMGAMFYDCSSLTTIYASTSFDVSAVGSSGDSAMFTGCSRLVGGSGTAYGSTSSSVTSRSLARIDAPGAPGYFTASCRPSDHNIVIIADEDVCEKGGTSEVIRKCTVCGREFFHDFVELAPGHVYVTDPAVEATCVTEGLTQGMHCATCGKVFVAQKKIPMTGHTAVVDKAVAPTCPETGLTEGSHCSVCGQVLVAQEVVASLGGHDPVADDAVDATCTEPGLTGGFHCSRCGEVLVAQEAVPAKGHVVVQDAATEATCTEPGFSAGSHCSVCGQEITPRTEVPALGHDCGAPTVTFSDDGNTATIVWTCGRDASHKKELAVQSASRVAAAATCFAAGTTEYSVDVAAADGWPAATATKTIAGIPATGSTYGAPEIVFAADGKTATATWTSRENASVKVIAECTVSARVTKPATCTDKGETTYTAFADGGSENLPAGSAAKVVADIDALGHEFTGYVSNGDATCEHDGTETAVCARGCGATDTRVTAGSKKPHAWGAPVILFSEDGASATVIWTCSSNVSHVKVADCAVASEVVSEASCCTAKLVRYTATAAAEGMPQGTASKIVQAAPAQGHSFGDPVIAFADDMGSATATWTCAKDPSHVVTASCKVEKRVGTQATCFDNGDMLCVASFAADNGNLTALACEHEAIPAAGHHFQGRVCPDCGTHLGDVNGNGVVNVVDAQVAYDIAIGKGDYSDLPGCRAYRAAADVTGTAGSPDGELDASDAFRIQYVALCGWDID